MKRRSSSRSLMLIASAIVVSVFTQSVHAAECEVAFIDRTAISVSAENNFSDTDITQIDGIISDLTPCVAHPDPTIRDGLAYETLTRILRSERLGPARIADLKQSLYSALDKEDDKGFSAPFAALLLSEVARTDRIQPHLTDGDFDAMVTRATDYVRSVRDYRGYMNEGGWRHGVAHGADWLLQLSVNPRLSDQQRDLIVDAIGSQVQAHDAHSYIFGEPGRLARPIHYLAARNSETTEFWSAHIMAFSDPAPLESWSDAFFDEGHLARLHNVRAFLYALYIAGKDSDNEGVKALQSALQHALQSLP